MDITQALKDTENLLRDFIATVLQKSFGETWLYKCGVSADRVEIWKSRKITEEKQQKSGVVEERLLYYADFYDLQTILKKNWSGEFSAALGEWKTMEVFLDELGKLRDPDAHRRELLSHQKHLIMGISGEIRTRLIRYRSKQETSEDFFPRIESARDSLGNIFTIGGTHAIHTDMCLRIGDVIEFIVTASDPLGDKLLYSKTMGTEQSDWQESNVLTQTITENHVSQATEIFLNILSPRKFHAHESFDDFVIFSYQVLPPRD